MKIFDGELLQNYGMCFINKISSLLVCTRHLEMKWNIKIQVHQVVYSSGMLTHRWCCLQKCEYSKKVLLPLNKACTLHTLTCGK